MSNRNHGLTDNGNGNEVKRPEKVKERFIQINWRAGARKLGKLAVGFCAVAGAACAGSYAAGAMQAKKNSGPATEHETVTRLTDT